MYCFSRKFLVKMCSLSLWKLAKLQATFLWNTWVTLCEIAEVGIKKNCEMLFTPPQETTVMINQRVWAYTETICWIKQLEINRKKQFEGNVLNKGAVFQMERNGKSVCQNNLAHDLRSCLWVCVFLPTIYIEIQGKRLLLLNAVWTIWTI